MFSGYGRWGVGSFLDPLPTMRSLFRTQRELALENLVLRQQVAALIRTRSGRHLRLGVWDRAFWVVLSQVWTGWREALAIVERQGQVAEPGAASRDQLARFFDSPAISRATSTNALSAGDTWARLGKYRKNPGTAAAYCSRTTRRLPRRSSSAISGSNA